MDETDPIAGGRLTDRIGIGVLTRVVPRDLVNEVFSARVNPVFLA